MRRRTWCPALAVSLSLFALCGCGTAEIKLGGTAHEGPEGCGTIHLHGAPARGIAFHIGYVAEPGLLTVPGILRWYPCGAPRPDRSWRSLTAVSMTSITSRGLRRRLRRLRRCPARLADLPSADERRPAHQPDTGRSFPVFTSGFARWTHIAYTESATRDSVWLMENDGSDRRRLTPADWSRTPVWSPDGRQLAFIRGTSCGCSMSAMAVGESSTGRSRAVDLPRCARRALDRLRRRRLRSAHRLTSQWPHPPAGAP